MDKNGSKIARTFAAVSVTMGALLYGGGLALATAPADPGGTGAALGEVGTGVTSWVENYGVPVIVSLLLLGVGVFLLIRWGKKARNMI